MTYKFGWAIDWPMKLTEYLRAKGIRKYVFAGKIGVTPSMVTAYCRGKMWPGRVIMEEIARETEGHVTANDFLQTDVPVPAEPVAAGAGQ